jgi:hypothetical protein
MKDSSIVLATWRFIRPRTGSASRVSIDPPRSSSQFGPQAIVSMASPVMRDLGRATGTLREFAGAERSLSYS